MTRLVFQHRLDPDYPEDIDQIVKALKYQGYDISRADAELAWQAVSDDSCAGWLILPKYGRDIVSMVMPYLKEES